MRRHLAPADAAPLTLAEVSALFDAHFGLAQHIVLAVSGGSDSTALMHLVAQWRAPRAGNTPSVSVVSVDHGLRPGSAAEAAAVAASARRLGLTHTTLHWIGPKPVTGLQAAAREARYRLIVEHMQRQGWLVLATGHTADDQAETLLMRLARGSGIDGLAGMREIAARAPIQIVRPLLGLGKQRLQAMLRHDNVSWIEDPSNADAAFERSHWRQARPALDRLGLTHQNLATSARRLERARSALAWATDAAVGQAGDKLQVSDLGYVELDWGWLTTLPPEIRLRILTAILRSVGGQTRPLSLQRLEALTEGRRWQTPAGRTLGGVTFSAPAAGRVAMLREIGRDGLPVMDIAPGASMTWDNRFSLSLSPRVKRTLRVAALGQDGLAWLVKHAGLRRPPVPVDVLRALPGLWRETGLGHESGLVAAPLLGYTASGIEPQHISCAFTSRPFAT